MGGSDLFYFQNLLRKVCFDSCGPCSRCGRELGFSTVWTQVWAVIWLWNLWSTKLNLREVF